MGVEERLYVDPETRAFDVRRPSGDGWVVAAADEDGWVGIDSLGVGLRAGGGRLEARTGDRAVEL